MLADFISKIVYPNTKIIDGINIEKIEIEISDILLQEFDLPCISLPNELYE
jgi:hypothetical protein